MKRYIFAFVFAFVWHLSLLIGGLTLTNLKTMLV